MGVTKMFLIIDQNGNTFGSHGTTIKLVDMAGKNVIMDGNLIAYQCLTALRECDALRDSEGRITTHLKILLNKLIKFNKLGIKQLWVFDNLGQNPRKLETNIKRKKTSSQYSRLRLTSEHYEEIKELLRYMGIAYIIAPVGIEAEQFASWMTHPVEDDSSEDAFETEDTHYHYVMSTDSDVLMFGGNMLRQYTTRSKVNNKWKSTTHYALFDYDEFMNKVDLTQKELFEIATVMGHDFYPQGVSGTAVKTVYKKVKSGAVVLTDEQEEALVQFLLDPDEYLNQAEFVQEAFNPDAIKEMLLVRDFKEHLLDKQLDNFDTSLL